MSRSSKLSTRQRRRDEKKKRKMANYVKFGPKSKDGSAKKVKKLKGEKRPRGRVVHTTGYARWCAKQKALAARNAA